MKKYLLTMLMAAVFVAIAFGIGYAIFWGGNYPTGSDTLCHIYKGRILYQDILKGNWYPLYDENWYNGVQMMRYWAPLPVYVLAGCQALAFGNVFGGYLLFVEFIFFFGALSWLYIGYKKERILFGAFVGCLWFFMPNNLYALFGEGNLPRALSMIFLPLFVYLLHEYMMEDKGQALPMLSVVFVFILLCHVGYGGMIALATLLFCGIFRIAYSKKKKARGVIAAILISFAMIGVWLYPSLKGGISSTDSSQVMKGFFQSALHSLNPVYRLQNSEHFYFGLAAFLLVIFGIIAARKQQRIYFWEALLIFILTTTTMYDALVILPGSQYLWMLRFISIALCFLLFGLILWKSLKKLFLVVLCLLLIVDTIPSVYAFSGDGKQSAEERLVSSAKDELLLRAREVTKQRMCFIDGSTTGATGQYQATALNDKEVKQTFGAGWQSAATAKNIVSLNEAANNGYYLYLFDRAKEMGNDTILIKLSELEYDERDIAAVDDAANRSGYQRMEMNGSYVLYHFNAEDCFGLISEYEGIGIGKYAGLMSMPYPSLKETEDSNLNHYSFSELSKYKLVYLAGFTYDSKKKAEALIRKLAQAGVKVVISADGLPTDKHTGSQDFLGVICQQIEFQNGYPTLYVHNSRVECYLFNHANADWKAVYLVELERETGYLFDNDNRLSFMGNPDNENITFIGLNLPYHVYLTHDEDAKGIMDGLIGNEMEKLPMRRIVPLKITTNANRLEITAEENNVNTTLAYHDIFSSKQDIRKENNLLYVDDGKTVISMSYPYRKEGGILSGIGFLLWIILIRTVRRRYGIKEAVSKPA